MGHDSDIFTPSPKQVPLLLDLLQSAACSLEDIAEELRITVAALTVYLASDEAIELLAQAELASARKGRLAATAQLDKCAHALSLILEGYIHDVTVAIRRDIPKTRRENLIHQESARRAATQLFKIAHFSPRIFTTLRPLQTSQSRDASNAPSTSGGRGSEGAGDGASASQHSFTIAPAASPARLLSPHPRREVPESHLEGGMAVRGPDGDAPAHQPDPNNAQPNTLHDASHSPSPGGGREGAGGGFTASEHSSTISPAASPAPLLSPHDPSAEDKVADSSNAAKGYDASHAQVASVNTAASHERARPVSTIPP